MGWTVTAVNTGSVVGATVASVLAVVTKATELWGRYFNFHPNTTIDVTVNIISLPGSTLAQAGPFFYSDHSSGGVTYFQAGTIIEMLTGADPNGGQYDIDIDIDLETLQQGRFFLGTDEFGTAPGNQFDLLTVIQHEIGHGLGFLSFNDSPTQQTTFEALVSGTVNKVFNGANAVAVYGGPVPLTDDPSHLAIGGFLMSATIAQGNRYFVTRLDTAMLQDAGAPVRVPTSGNDVLWGYRNSQSINLGSGNDVYNAINDGDLVSGGDGDDEIYTWFGHVRFDGGADVDTAYADNSTIALVIGTDPSLGPNGVSINKQTVPAVSAWNIERVVASAFDDLLSVGHATTVEFRLGGGNDVARAFYGFAARAFGEAGNDLFEGSTGNDYFDGGDGDDALIGGGGADQLFGGAGFDLAHYRNAGSAVTLDLQTPSAGSGDAQGDVIAVDVELIEGSQFGDTLRGDANGNAFNGGAGGDFLYGRGGSDVLVGGDGFSLTSGGASIFRLYEATLDRNPDAGGLANWTATLNGGTSLVAIAAGFVNSPEFQSVYGALNNTLFVTLLYNNVLDRAPDQGGLDSWVGLLNGGASRESVVIGFSESPEFQRNSAVAADAYATFTLAGATSGQVFRLYQATLDRTPDESGFSYWTSALYSGQSLATITTGFILSPEFQTAYGSLNNMQFVTLLYNNVLNRAPDQPGLDGWVGLLNGGASRESVVNGFSESPEFQTNTASGLLSFLRAQLPEFNDTLEGGAGTDFLFGGRGGDVFRFAAVDAAADNVYGFEAADSLSLIGFGYANAAAALSHFTQVGADVIFADQGQTITFHETVLATIQASTISLG